MIEARFDEQTGEDRRGAARRTLRLGVDGQFGSGSAKVTVHNISTTGMMIQTETRLDRGELFAVDLPEVGEQVVEVVWSDGPMFGCRFSHPISGAALSAAQLRAEAAPALDDHPAEDFGERLHRLRVERGLSLSDIASRLGVSKPTVWAWEHGKSRPVERRLTALAEALGVTPGGLEPGTSGATEILDRSRRQLAQAYGVDPSSVRIMIEL